MGYCSITIRKSYQNYDWVNTYIVTGNMGDTMDLVAPLVEREQQIHLDIVKFEQVHVAIYPQVSPPELNTVPLSVMGLRNTGSNKPADPQACAFVAFGTVNGRPGKKFYRYCLYQTEVEGKGDDGFITSSHLVTIGNEAAGIVSDVAQTGNNLVIGKYYRLASGQVSVKYGSADTHHGWYNRTAGA